MSLQSSSQESGKLLLFPSQSKNSESFAGSTYSISNPDSIIKEPLNKAISNAESTVVGLNTNLANTEVSSKYNEETSDANAYTEMVI